MTHIAEPPSLSQLAAKWHTDKAFFYAPYYEELLAGKQVRKVLEVGIGSPEVMAESISRAGWTDYQAGASLRMWRDYFPNAEIYGIDTNSAAVMAAMDIDNGIFTLCLDSTKDELSKIGPFDLIVDDGSHEKEDQQATMSRLVPLLAPGGIYVTEDVTEPFETPYPAEFVNFTNGYGRASIYMVKQ